MINKAFTFERIVASVSILFIFISGFFCMTDSFKFMQIPLLFTGVTMVLFTTIVTRNFVLCINKIYFFWSIISIIAAFVSFIILNDSSLLINAFAMFFVYMTFVICLSRIHYYETDIDAIMIGIFILVTFLSLKMNRISFTNYCGMFYNLNSLGGVYCTIFTYFLATLKKYKKFDISKILSIIIIFFSFFMVVISSSRGAFVSCCMIFLLWVLLEINKNDALSKRTLIRILFLVVLLLIIYRFTPLYNIIDNSIINKFIRKSKNITSDRGEIWIAVWKEKKLFGYGRNYFDNFRWGAHNTFVSLLGQYGIIGLLSYVGLFFAFLRKNYDIYKRYKDYAPFLFSICFLSLSMTEGMLMKISMFVMYYGISYCFKLTNDKNFNEKK